MKPEIKVYLQLCAASPELRDTFEDAFCRAYPASFDKTRTLKARLEYLGPWGEALKRQAVPDLDRKLKHSVLFDTEKETLANLDKKIEEKREELLRIHPQGFIKD